MSYGKSAKKLCKRFGVIKNSLYLCTLFSLNGKEGTLHIVHETYYHDRLTEWDLCHDFPADEIFIDGLHAMQSHFCTNNVPIDIPIVRVMNAAHFMLAYAFSNECSGDQAEYDVLAYGSVGHDKQVMLVTLIVLAAMLKRTEGLRARMCHNMLLEDRSEDFYDGVSLYDQFLRSAEKHFAEEDFLLDTHQQILRQQEEITRLTSENIQLKYTITTMENQQNNQYNNYGTINKIGTQNNYYYTIAQPPQQSASCPSSSGAPQDIAEKENSLFCRITQAAYDKGVAQQVENELQSAAVSAPKLVKVIRTNEALGYLDTQNINSTDLYELLNDHFQLEFKVRTFQLARSK